MQRVLFVCVENACRSQMAEGFAREFGSGVIEAYSAGSRPAGRVNPDAVRVMAEAGVDIAGYRSKGFRELPVKEFDCVVTLGCGDQCPWVPAAKTMDWQINDPRGRNLDYFRKVRDIIRLKVKDLVHDIREAR